MITNRLQGDDPTGVYERLLAVARSIGYRVEDADFDGAKNGDCSFADRRIRVRRDNAPAQRSKTLAHEHAHALLHEEFDGGRELGELEAESTAYVVCAHLGIETADYSFGYVAGWAGGGDQAVTAIRESGARIQKASETILDALNTAGEVDESVAA